MSNLMLKLALLNTKFMVNTYTAVTLPFYYVYQRPWQKLRMIKSFDVETFKDRHGRTVYHYPKSMRHKHPYIEHKTFQDVMKTMDRNRVAVGVRDIISEQLQLDKDGKPVIVEGRELVKTKLDDKYKWFTVGEVLDKADAIARGLIKLGAGPSEKVMIYAENSYEWFLVAIALNRSSAITMTLFSTLSDPGVVYGLNQSEAKYLIIGEPLLKKFDKLSDQVKCVEKIVYIPNHPKSYRNNDPETKAAKEKIAKKYPLYSLDEVMVEGRNIAPYEFPKAKPEDWILIMYTSGTTGDPKGVIMSNENFQISLMNLLRADMESPFKLFKATVPAYLPMAHLFGYMLHLAMFLSDGRIGFSSPMTLLNASPVHVSGQDGDAKLIQPEFLPTVPLVLERIIKETYKKLNARSLLLAEIFTYLMEYKIRWTQRGFDTPIINRLICKKINDEFGGKLTVALTGGAPLHEKTQALAKAALNVDNILIAYGSTEMTGYATGMKFEDLSLGRAGIPQGTVKYYLDDWVEGGYTTKDKPNPRGELIFGGPTISLGYYKKPEETAADFFVDEDGCRWFRSGDIGEVFPDGTLKIIDRKKDLLKLANGEFVSLGKIESGLRSSGYVENVFVGTHPYRNEIIALIVPNRLTLQKLAQEMGKGNMTFEQWCDDPEINQKVLESIRRKCQELSFTSKEIPVKIELVKEQWTTENNMLTAALKLKRKVVRDFYQDRINAIFDSIPEK